MPVTDPTLSWTDQAWLEAGDNTWRRSLRLQQAWWRQELAKQPAGPRLGGDRLVASMLPSEVVGWKPNLLTDEAVDAVLRPIQALASEEAAGG